MSDLLELIMMINQIVNCIRKLEYVKRYLINLFILTIII
jgi:hypothetical protein